MALADMSDLEGICWPTIQYLANTTCFSKRAIIEAIARLESLKALEAHRTHRRNTAYRLTPEEFIGNVFVPCSSDSRQRAHVAFLGASAAPSARSSRNELVHETHPTLKETDKNKNEPMLKSDIQISTTYKKAAKTSSATDNLPAPKNLRDDQYLGTKVDDLPPELRPKTTPA